MSRSSWLLWVHCRLLINKVHLKPKKKKYTCSLESVQWKWIYRAKILLYIIHKFIYNVKRTLYTAAVNKHWNRWRKCTHGSCSRHTFTFISFSIINKPKPCLRCAIDRYYTRWIQYLYPMHVLFSSRRQDCQKIKWIVLPVSLYKCLITCLMEVP